MTISGRERLWTAPSSRLDPDPRGNCVYVIELYSDIEKKTIKKTRRKTKSEKSQWLSYYSYVVPISKIHNIRVPSNKHGHPYSLERHLTSWPTLLKCPKQSANLPKVQLLCFADRVAEALRISTLSHGIVSII